MADAERERRHGGDAVASMGATRTGSGGWHGCTGECCDGGGNGSEAQC